MLFAHFSFADTFDLNKADYKTIYSKYCKPCLTESIQCYFQKKLLPSFCKCSKVGEGGCISFEEYSLRDNKLIDEYKQKIEKEKKEKKEKERIKKEKAKKKTLQTEKYVKCLMKHIKVNSSSSHKEVVELFCKVESFK